MRRNLVITHPHMGSYAAVFQQFLRHLFPSAVILSPPPTTLKTLELGSRYSPDFVCAPFKFNIGNYIEALEQGANVLFQTGTGCRYGYYGELQEQILRDLGYDFQFACLSRERVVPDAALRIIRELGCALPVPKILEAGILALRSIYVLDRYEFWMRENVGFEAVSGSCEAVRRALLEGIRRADSLQDLHAAVAGCKKGARRIKLDRPEYPLRVGVVGELYTLMEPFSNFYLEKQLARDGVSVSRAMGVWFLLLGRSDRRSLRGAAGYLDHTVGANGVDSVSQSLSYARRGYDGILHLKSFGCIPELNATPALLNLSREEGIPILQMSFDSNTSEIGVQTRLEAFSDMLRMRKEGQDERNREPGDGHWIGIHQGSRP